MLNSDLLSIILLLPLPDWLRGVSKQPLPTRRLVV
jgi:hypothetical protein